MRPGLFSLLLLLTVRFGTVPAQQFWEHSAPYVNFPPVVNPIEKPGYVLVFHDEFNGPPFDDQLWNRQNYFNGSGGEATAVDNLYHVYPDPVGQANYAYRHEGGNGYLQMIARKQSPPISMYSFNFPWDTNNAGAELRPYTTATIESRDAFKFGYLELRAKVPAGGDPHGTSFLPAAWLFFMGNPYLPEGHGREIDLFEIWTHCPRVWLTNYWSYGWDCECTEIPDMDPWGQTNALGQHACARNASFFLDPQSPRDLTNEFWTYGLDWDTERIHFYLNNVLVRTVTQNCNVSRDFSKFILNLAVMASYANDCAASTGITPDVAVMEVDYVRFYKRLLSPHFATEPQTAGGGYTPRRYVGDVNGDRRADIIAFGWDSVEVALGREGEKGLEFAEPQYLFSDLCPAQGWVASQHPIQLADVNADGKRDIVAFGDAGVFLSMADGDLGRASYSAPRLALAFFGRDSGAGAWDMALHPRLVGDVNGDAKDDIVGFGQAGTWVALANAAGNGFESPQFWTAQFGLDTSAGAWDPQIHRRKLADMDGDGRKDLVGLRGNEVKVALCTGRTFKPAETWSTDIWDEQAFNYDRPLMLVGDADGDGHKDLLNFKEDGLHVAYGTGAGFAPAAYQWPMMGYGPQAGDWRVSEHPRRVADVTGDGLDDIIGFGMEGVWLAEAYAEAGQRGFRSPRLWYNEMGAYTVAGPWSERDARTVADLDGDGIYDVIGFGADGVYGHESPNCPLPQPCDPDFEAGIRPHFLPQDTLRPHYSASGQPLDAPGLSITLYPNPSSDWFNLEVESASEGPVRVEVFSSLGSRVGDFQEAAQGRVRFRVDLSGFSEGVYWIRITQGDARAVAKLLRR